MKLVRIELGIGLTCALAVALWACHDSGATGASLPAILGTPSITLSDNPRAPMAATLRLVTDKPSSLILHVSDGVHDWDLSYPQQSSDHHLPVRGLHPGESHTFSVTVRGPSGAKTVPLEDVLIAPALPPSFPALDITVHDRERLEPGYTLFVPISERPFIIAIDVFGKVAWYLALEYERITDLGLLRNGNLIFVQQNCRIVEIDFEGTAVNAWETSNAGASGCREGIANSNSLAVRSAHHEAFEMPTGNLLTLSHADIVVEDYPLSHDMNRGTATQTVLTDVVVEFSRDGTVLREHVLSDILDPSRIGYDSVGNANDWAHANAAIYDARDNSYIVSARHQDAIFKFDRDDGELRWILGTPDGWVEPWFSRVLIPQNFSAAQFSWHQHAPEITPDGTIMLFDNGNYRARPFAPKRPAAQNFSRAVEYAIDEERMLVREVWEYGSPNTSIDGDYAPFLGDADVLPVTNNVLITFGGITRTRDTGLPTDQLAQVARNARIVEVSRDTAPEKLLEIYCGTIDFADDDDCSIYRALHVASLVH